MQLTLLGYLDTGRTLRIGDTGAGPSPRGTTMQVPLGQGSALNLTGDSGLAGRWREDALAVARHAREHGEADARRIADTVLAFLQGEDFVAGLHLHLYPIGIALVELRVGEIADDPAFGNYLARWVEYGAYGEYAEGDQADKPLRATGESVMQQLRRRATAELEKQRGADMQAEDAGLALFNRVGSYPSAGQTGAAAPGFAWVLEARPESASAAAALAFAAEREGEDLPRIVHDEAHLHVGWATAVVIRRDEAAGGRARQLLRLMQLCHGVTETFEGLLAQRALQEADRPADLDEEKIGRLGVVTAAVVAMVYPWSFSNHMADWAAFDQFERHARLRERHRRLNGLTELFAQSAERRSRARERQHQRRLDLVLQIIALLGVLGVVTSVAAFIDYRNELLDLNYRSIGIALVLVAVGAAGALLVTRRRP